MGFIDYFIERGKNAKSHQILAIKLCKVSETHFVYQFSRNFSPSFRNFSHIFSRSTCFSLLATGIFMHCAQTGLMTTISVDLFISIVFPLRLSHFLFRLHNKKQHSRFNFSLKQIIDTICFKDSTKDNKNHWDRFFSLERSNKGMNQLLIYARNPKRSQ